MDIKQFCDWLQEQAFAVAIGDSSWLFPAIEIVHVFAIALVVGSIAMVDLRLLGWTNNARSASDVIAQFLPVTWIAFAFAVASGALMFSTNAAKYSENVPFRLKMICLLLAGANMALFHVLTQRRIAKWDTGVTPIGAWMAGAFSLLFWIAIVGAGRWIGFTM